MVNRDGKERWIESVLREGRRNSSDGRNVRIKWATARNPHRHAHSVVLDFIAALFIHHSTTISSWNRVRSSIDFIPIVHGTFAPFRSHQQSQPIHSTGPAVDLDSFPVCWSFLRQLITCWSLPCLQSHVLRIPHKATYLRCNAKFSLISPPINFLTS